MNWKSWFLENKSRIASDGVSSYFGIIPSITIEELYQAFKARMIDEQDIENDRNN